MDDPRCWPTCDAAVGAARRRRGRVGRLLGAVDKEPNISDGLKQTLKDAYGG